MSEEFDETGKLQPTLQGMVVGRGGEERVSVSAKGLEETERSGASQVSSR